MSQYNSEQALRINGKANFLTHTQVGRYILIQGRSMK